MWHSERNRISTNENETILNNEKWTLRTNMQLKASLLKTTAKQNASLQKQQLNRMLAYLMAK